MLSAYAHKFIFVCVCVSRKCNGPESFMSAVHDLMLLLVVLAHSRAVSKSAVFTVGHYPFCI